MPPLGAGMCQGGGECPIWVHTAAVYRPESEAMIHENDGDYERDLAMREMDEWAAERAIDYADFSQDQQAEAELDR